MYICIFVKENKCEINNEDIKKLSQVRPSLALVETEITVNPPLHKSLILQTFRVHKERRIVPTA